MADGDYYSRKLAPKWKKVGTTFLGGQDVGVVARLGTEAVAETMRLSGGIPGFKELSVGFAAASRDGDRDAWTAASEHMRRVHRHHPNTELAVLAAQGLLENDPVRLRDMSFEALRTTLAEAAVSKIAEYGFDKCRQDGLPQAAGSIGDAQSRQRAAISAMDTAGLAKEVLRAEDGHGFKAPARPSPAVGTETLLGRTLVGPS